MRDPSAPRPRRPPLDVLKSLTRGVLGVRTRRSLRFDVVRLRARFASSSYAGPLPRQLHLGCGGRKVAGFLNVDVASSDWDLDLASGSLPWPDNSFDAVVSQQVIEHLDLQQELIPLLREIRRVCAPGAEIWLACPDMESICRSYLEDGGAALLADRLKRWPDFSLNGLPPQQMVNILFHQAGEHVNLFDYRLLKHVLESVGFEETARSNEAQLRERFPALPLRGDDDFSLYVRTTR